MTARRRSRGGAVRPAPRTNLTLQIEDLAPGGRGVAHATLAGERRAIFVRGAAVGDEVEVAVDTSARPARGDVVRFLMQGPGRVEPPCAYVEACGACDWLHLSPETQAEARERQLRRALPPSLRELPVRFHEAEAPLHYRTRARLHVRASGGRAIVGFHGVGSHDVVEVATCVALDPLLDAAAPKLAALLDGAHGQGEAQLALGAGGRPVVELRWAGKMTPATFGRLERGVATGDWAGGRIHLEGVTRPASVGDPAPRMTSADGDSLLLAPGGFAQASERANVTLSSRVLELSKEVVGAGHTSSSVVELYAGAGNFTVLLARAFGRVTAVESDANACEAARTNLAARGLAARVTCADADAFEVPGKTDLVVLDPPRRGASAASAALATSSVKAIVYVSCDVPTLGRDLAVLLTRFEVIAIESFAMFPGTSHSETVVALRRLPRGGRGAASP